MISKVSLNSVRYNQPQTQPVVVDKPTFKSLPVKHEKLQELNGLETQAIYMSVLVQKAPSTMNDLEMPIITKISDETDLNRIEGTPIYNSEGELVSVVVENNYSKAVYKADSEHPDKVGSIELYEKATGKEISVQKNYYNENGQVEEFQVRTIEDTQAGRYHQSTDYDANDKIVYQQKSIDYLDGSRKYISKYRDGEYTVGQEANDGRTSYYNSYDKNKTLKSVEYSKATDSSTRSKMIKFYNGVAYSIEERKLSLEPKLTADKLIDKSQFEPTAPSGIAAVDKQHLLAEVLVNEDIEKTYYSNGSLETITVDGETLSFSDTGDIVSAKYDGKKVSFEEDCEVIEETLENGIVKNTKHYTNGSCRVELDDGDKTKVLKYRANGTVDYYYEKTKGSAPYEYDIDLSFNDAEVLQASY